MNMIQNFFIVIFMALLSQFAVAQEDKYSLPELKYKFDALEPHIDARTMEIHYSKHHKAYLDNLNKSGGNTILGASAATIEDLMLSVDGKNASLRNNGGGHYNHTLFWDILSPTPQKMADGKLEAAIKNQFTSQDSLIKLMNAEGLKRFGSGWVWLVVTPFKTLSVTSTPNQDNPLMELDEVKRGIPVLGIDVWEHAYYLNYQNKRGEYLKNIWNVVDWAQVGKNYEAALQSPLLKKIDKSNWKSFREFNQLYSQITLPAKSGDYKLLKDKSAELLSKTEMLEKSNIPGSFQNTDLKKLLKELTSVMKGLHKSASKRPKDSKIAANLVKVEEVYKKVLEITSK
jgi:Fe-Mn family superoxide dismutase